jgi:polyisoprenoid-binding protein YceI
MLFRTIAVAAVIGGVVASPIAVRTAAPLSAAAPVALLTFNVDPAHTMVMFKVRHLGISTVTGRFAKFAGTFQLDPASGQVGTASLTAETASITTDNDRRDADLRSPNFFSADSFPQVTFASTRVTKGSGNKYKVEGTLTMHGVTKPVTLDAELAGSRETPRGWIAAVNMSGTVKRKEFGLMWDRMAEGIAVVSDDVTLQIEVEARENRPAPAP